ncbi:MAG: hypothetical protein R3D55_28190 [Chloroflexota bacterium]
MSTRDHLQLHPDAPITCDLHQFRAALHDVAAHSHDDLLHCTSCYQTLATAVSHSHGPFLADFFWQTATCLKNGQPPSAKRLSKQCMTRWKRCRQRR